MSIFDFFGKLFGGKEESASASAPSARTTADPSSQQNLEDFVLYISKKLVDYPDEVKVRTASAEMSEGNKQILHEVQKLQNATLKIKDSVGEMGIGARKINETGVALSEISGVMNDSISKIGNEIDLFRV